MSRFLATALAVLVLAQLVEGALVGLGDRLLPGCTALVLIGVGAGALWRARRARAPAAPTRGRGALLALGVALLVAASALVCELGLELLPASAAASLPARLALAAVALLPPSLLLGVLIGALLHGSLPPVLLGVVAGEVLLWAGGAGWLPTWVTGGVCAAVLALLGSRVGAQDVAADERFAPPLALLLGGAVALLVAVLARLVPAYTTPSSHAATDALAALLVPAALVTWPAALLARGGRSGAVLGGGGALLLAVALFHSVDALSLYFEPMAVVETTRNLHVQAAKFSPWMTDWWLWLLSFAALSAAALGLSLSVLRAAAAGGLACGAGLALLATQLVPLDPVRAPASWLLVASGLAAAAGPPLLLGRRGWLLSPLALAPLLASPLALRPGFDEVRRPGELGVEGCARTPLLDATLYSASSSASTSVEGRLARRTTFSCDPLALGLGPDGELAMSEPANDSCLGLRFGGVAWNPGHDPLGADGSVGRLTRVFAVAGRMLVAGSAAELLVADLHDARLLESATVASDAPLGPLALTTLASLGSGAWQAATVREVVSAAREAGALYDTIVLAPARASWPGSATLGSEGLLEHLAERLTAEGRCLLWLDTSDLDAGALRARVAAFGQVFGERAAAFVEPRELDPPFVLLVGWRLDSARPTAADLAVRLAALGEGGRRLPLRSPGDLGALLLRDGAGLAAAGEQWRELRATRPAPSSRWSKRGWAAVAAIADAQARPDRVIEGAPAAPPRSAALYEGLATHAEYDYDLADINETILEVRQDIDWQAFEREAALYAQAAQVNPEDPLLQHALASLLEPLALSGDYGRFARVYEETGARGMRNLRLAVLEAWVQGHSLEQEAAAAALQRAREQAAVR